MVGGTNWAMVVEQDRDEALQPVHELRHYIVLVIVLSTCGVFFTAWLLSRYVAIPIRRLSEAAHSLAKGDFAKVHIDDTGRKDEVGLLNEAFRAMMRKLQDRRQRLEEKVTRREAELKETDVRLKQSQQAATRSQQMAALGQLAAGGAVKDIKYIIYIDPKAYAVRSTLDTKRRLGRIIGELNGRPEIIDGRVIMMGPGRWGSSNILLEVNTTYADINHASVLVEIAREEPGHVPDVSYGTHFFLDLVESQIIYLPLYPDNPGADFNRAFFEASANCIERFIREADTFAPFIKVIDVPAAAGGRYAQVVADPQNGEALCFLYSPQSGSPTGQNNQRHG